MKPPFPRPPLRDMFARVPGRYDLLNRLFTFRRDVAWRSLETSAILSMAPSRFLDLGCGTGDLALEVARQGGPAVAVTGADFSGSMLMAARSKAEQRGLEGRISWVLADAGRLPFPDNHFDAVGLAFSFRNMVYRNPNQERHLREMVRVVRPGGRLFIAESSQPRNPIVRALCHFYIWWAVGGIGGLLSDRAAYRYLALSAIGFPEPETISNLLRAAGFSKVTHRPLLFGAAALHVAEK